HLLFSQLDPKTGTDLWVLPIDSKGAAGKPEPYLQSEAFERNGQFSPDGRWIVYASDESIRGQFQVYVQSFPVGAGKFQISTGAGGSMPRWRGDGREIFYAAPDGKLIAGEVNTTPRFEASAPQPLLDLRAMPVGSPVPVFRYDVTLDGKRFLVITPQTGVEGSGPPTPIAVVLNWTAAVRK